MYAIFHAKFGPLFMLCWHQTLIMCTPPGFHQDKIKVLFSSALIVLKILNLLKHFFDLILDVTLHAL